MGEEEEYNKEKQSFNSSLSNGGSWAIFFGIAGLAWGLLFLIANGNSGITPLLIYTIGGAALGFGLGFIYGIFPKQAKIFAILIIGIILFLILFIIIPNLSKTSGLLANPLNSAKFSSIEKTFSNLGDTISSYKYCLSIDSSKTALCPWNVDWEPAVQNVEEEYYVQLGISDKEIKDDRVNSIISLSVLNDQQNVQISFKPLCYHGVDYENKEPLEINNLGSYSFGDKFIFDYSRNEQKASFRCSGLIEKAVNKESYSEKIFVDLERPVSVDTAWNIYLGEGENLGTPDSAISEYINLISLDTMPFTEDRDYAFDLVIKMPNQKSELLLLNSLYLDYSLEDYNIQCNGLEVNPEGGLRLLNKNVDDLKKIFTYSKEKNQYSALCTLIVLNSNKKAISSPIGVKSEMVVLTKFSDTIKKYA